MLDFLKINLSNNIAILIIIIMFFFCLILFIKNRRLKEEIEELKLENQPLMDKHNFPKEDIISINNLSKNIKEETPALKEKQIKQNKYPKEKNYPKEEITELPKLKPIKEITKPKKENITKNKIELYQNKYQLNKSEGKKAKPNQTITNQPYTKNILQNSPKITSPVSVNTSDFDINEFVKKEKKSINNRKSKIAKEDYLTQISNQMSEELKPQTIELTDYEKEEEENAIISYQELLNVKNKIISISDEAETGEFIEELKKLRNSLN